ncbi:DUF4132 domain-containing protein [Stackebrandtia soli]|uniref:DUF4132 domain-containing protein n=1 Tax=Stackebrandtia soli TaxID=1892856 RepID=UPI0039EA8D62
MSPPELTDDTGLRWCPASDTHDIALDGSTLVCRNSSGRRLKSVPKNVRDTEIGRQLLAVREQLQRHERECVTTVESWMLGALPVPFALLTKVWADPAWRRALSDLAVTADLSAEPGLLKRIDETGRVGVVNLDAESEWLDSDHLYVPHPVLIEDLADVREFAAELGLSQTIPQLTREVYAKPAEVEGNRVTDYNGGEFDELRQARARTATSGFAVRGPYATCRASDAGRELQARYWIGDENPDYSTETGDLLWVDADERSVPLSEVGPIAWSEGIRMAALIFAGRKTDEK